jgi:hypothetical protein
MEKIEPEKPWLFRKGNSGMKNRQHSQATIDQMSATHKANHPMKGKHLPLSWRKNIQAARKGKPLGPMTEEHKLAIGNANKGVPKVHIKERADKGVARRPGSQAEKDAIRAGMIGKLAASNLWGQIPQKKRKQVI